MIQDTTPPSSMIILIVLVFAVLSEGVVWPPPDSLYRPIYHVGGLSNEPGYIGDGPSSFFFFDVIRSRHKFFSYHYTLNYRTLSLNHFPQHQQME